MIRGFLISRFQRRLSPNTALGRRISKEEESVSLCNLLAQYELNTRCAEIYPFFSIDSSAILPKYVQDSIDISPSESPKTRSSGYEVEKSSAGDIVTTNAFEDSENRVGQR